MSASSSSEKTPTPKTGDEVLLTIRGRFRDYGDGHCAVQTAHGSVLFTNDDRVEVRLA